MPEVHAKLSASISKRWMWGDIETPTGVELKGCPGSITLSGQVIEKPKANLAADTGTAAHEMGENCLLKGITPEDFVAQHPKDYITVRGSDDKIIKIPITEKMVQDVTMYTNTIWSDVAELEEDLGVEAQIYVEEEFSLNWLFDDATFEELADRMVESDHYPDVDDEFEAEELLRTWLTMFGTNDCSVVYPGKALYIYDYKNGRWPVPAENNTQFLYYAVGAAQVHNWDFEYVEMMAVQPNSMDSDKVPRWRITIDELREWAAIFKECAINTIFHPDVFNTGEHCHFCPARGLCKKQHDDAMEAAQLDFEDDFGVVEADESDDSEIIQIGENQITANQMKKILDNADFIKNFVSAVQHAAFNQLNSGNNGIKHQIGQKLVYKKKNRAYNTPESEIIAYCEDELLLEREEISAPGKLLAMSKLEAIIGSDEIEQFVERPDPELIMVPMDDKREEVIPAIDDFDDEL